jgi:EGF domain-containing protein/List-Bact-rpt repeat protein
MMKIKALRGVVRTSIQAAAFAVALPYGVLMGCAPKERPVTDGDAGASAMNDGGAPEITSPSAGSAAGGMSGAGSVSSGGSSNPSAGGRAGASQGGSAGTSIGGGGGEAGEPPLIDPCDPSPCENDGACSSDGSCNCQSGFSGATCGVKLDPCADAPCQNGGACMEQGSDFSCECTAGYEGKTCSDEVDDCVPDPCQHGGTCEDGHNTFSCHCPDGYSGTKCEREVHGCADTPCLNGASCTDQGAVYTCHCAVGFSGSNCETNINDCSPNPCKNGGSCADGVNKYTCSCAAGYSGSTCQTNIDDCAASPCKNGGVCNDGLNSYACSCAAGWSGDTCQTNIDECSPNPCKNGGSCSDGINKYTCSCATGWSGSTCETSNTVNLSVTATGPGGSVTSVPAGQITCTAPNSGGGCSKAYSPGAVITLNAKAANGSLTRFAGWTGACTGFAQTCTLTMDAAKSVGASFVSRTNNLVFVSSATYPTTLGSAVAYDAKCNELATAAGINNSGGNGYIAWTSDSASDATTRLGTAKGFILMDGRPFASTKASFLTGNAILNPIRLTEKGLDVGDVDVMTGTNADGTHSLDYTCNDWTGGLVPSDGISAGSSLGGPIVWGGESVVGCNDKRIFCFDKTETAALAFTPATGKRIWLSTQYSGTAAADPDAHCALSRPAGVSAARALVAYSSAPASDVLGSATTYVRPDGVVVGTGAEIVAQTLHSGIWQYADGSYIDEFDNGASVFVGATSLTVNGANTCNNWQDQSDNSMVVIGNFHTASKQFWNYITFSCNVLSKLYCVEP